MQRCSIGAVRLAMPPRICCSTQSNDSVHSLPERIRVAHFSEGVSRLEPRSSYWGGSARAMTSASGRRAIQP
jgi:hypothetical protein